jgi:SPASM domain peptide maturase of grasp-with-spasm system
MHTSQKEQWFKLHSSCIPVKGKESSLIYDIEKQELYPISNDHYELLSLCNKYSISQLKNRWSDLSAKDIDTFLEHFITNHLGFYTTAPQSFPDLELEWKSPVVISNAIIQVNAKSTFDLKELIHQLHDLGCDAIQLRLEDDFKVEALTEMMAAFEGTRIRFIDLMLPYHLMLTKQVLVDLMLAYKRIGILRLYNALEDGVWQTEENQGAILLYTKDIRIDSIEIIEKGRFTTNPYVFMEAQQHNVGLNRKVCIDATGAIKNYINHTKDWGNIEEETLKSIVLTSAFQAKWFVANDQIEKCRECSFRYCCISNVDLEKREGLYYKLADCSIH